MKYIIYFFIIVILLLTSCGGFSKNACLSSVKKMFPDAKVYAPFQGSALNFIVIDSTNIYLVQTASLNSANVTKVIPYTLK
jgi:hypothetical protein